MTTFRLATINVHSFNKPSSSTNNISELISIFEPLKLDLIAVQEVQHNDKWKGFYQRLSLPFSIQEPRNRVFGNAVASRYSFYSNSIQQTSSPCHGGMRSILQCRLNGIDNLTFAVTHLDHINEDDRLQQIKEFNPFKQNIDILMGDMNALTREDYSDDYYSDMVVETREKNLLGRTSF
jgi:endonuclease/exonuclease/phosphatase family metal-dependent hydrolase